MHLDADDPVKTFEEDKLSFGPLARGIAKELIAYDRPNSFAIGVNGRWGSGKTSLLNLVERALEDQRATDPNACRIVFFQFSTWIVENRESLLRQLLPLIEKRIREEYAFADDYYIRRGLEALRRYSYAVKGIEQGLSLTLATATLFSMPVAPWLAPLAALFTEIGKAIGVVPADSPTLDDLRDRARRALSDAKVRIVIFLDDLDRLEPKEILEIARLVRSTLDLPHLAFLISYDRDQAAQCIKYELGVDGEEYLEKIIQLPINVPPSDSYDLARLFASRLEPVLGEQLSEDQKKRASQAVWRDLRQLFLTTPRDVARILNSVSLAWAMLKHEVDPADLIFVSALRTSAPAICDWVRQYLHVYFVDQVRRVNTDILRAEFHESLKAAVAADKLAEVKVIEALANYLPGITSFTFNASDPSLFAEWSNNSALAASRNKRLASAHHWSNYFDLMPARSGFSEAWFWDFIQHAEETSRARDEFIRLAGDISPNGKSVADRLLDRIRAEAEGADLSETQRRILARLIAEMADELINCLPAGGFLEVRPEMRLEGLVRTLLAPLPEADRNSEFLEIVSRGKSLSWTMYLLRSQMFAHGRIGERRRDERSIISAAGLEAAIDAAHARLKAAAEAGTLQTQNNLIYIALAWRDVSGSTDEPRDWFTSATSSNLDFVALLDKFKQKVESTAGDYWRIDPSIADLVGDVSLIRQRLQMLRSDDQTAGDARRLLELIDHEL